VSRRATGRLGLAAALLLAGCGGGGGVTPVRPGPLALPLGDAPQRGPDDAWVTVIEFSDFQCPSCALAAPSVRTLLADLEGEVRLRYRHFPLQNHLAALPAAEAAECARLQGPAPDGHFWAMHDTLFAHQATLAAVAASPDPLLAELAAGIPGLDLDAWGACLASHQTRARIAEDQALAAPFLLGTPTFVVNGTQVTGEPALRAAVEAALAWAAASGIPRTEYYDRAVLGL
jgi:protein-disulfide isomerase